MVHAIVIKNNGSDHEADDLFQETVTKFYSNVQNGLFEEKSSIKTYLYAIARNCWLQHLRKNKPMMMDSLEDINENQLMAPLPDGSYELEQQFGNLIGSLSEACREILTDFYYNQLTTKEMKVKYGLSSDQAAKTKKYRCLKKLIDKFKSIRSLEDSV